MTSWNVRDHPGLVGLAAAAVLLLGTTIHAARYVPGGEPGTGSSGVAAGPAADDVGPVVGDDVAAYIAERHELLDELSGGPIRAVVSFEEAVTVDELPLPEELVVERLQLRLPGRQEPVDLPADDGAADRIEELVAESRSELETELAELETLLEEDLGDPAFEEDFAIRAAELAESGEAAARGAVVFAAVVVADGASLRDLVGDPEVRLVDPGGPPAETTQSRFRGLLPADRVTVSTGRSS
ncbi:MAG: hypothetical protein WEB09_09035 [Nitriliruptor sp.]